MNGDETIFTKEEIATLRNKVLAFLKKQPGYERYSSENLRAFQEDRKTIGVTFGDNIQAGIAGFGSTVDEGYADFVRSWGEFNGFEWIKENK
jgi:hypothetical protein